MRVLLLISEVWNDKKHPNNNMSNWFDGIADVELATIYASPGYPDNKCCTLYFQLTEASMVRSLFLRNRAGHSFIINNSRNSNQGSQPKPTHIYRLFKSISNEFIRLIRDIIWKIGRIDNKRLEQFINEFHPDIIFTQRMGSVKMCRIERLVKTFTDVPMVAYTGDDEYSLKQYNVSPIYWVRRFWVRNELKRNIPMYDLFYSQSETQMREFREEFGSNTKFLVKCGAFDKDRIHKSVNNPIQITYAGKLYCNRWKTLALIAECIRQVNQDNLILQLKIYTRDKITERQSKFLNDGTNCIIMGGVTADELKYVYSSSDILLHVESFDKANSLLTKYSFSTKIMECLSSGCAVMAVGSKNQAGCSYLRKQDAAFVASSKDDIMMILHNICSTQELILEYAQKAYECGIRNHRRQDIQSMLKSDFNQLICNGNY